MPHSSFHTAKPQPKALSEKAPLKLIVLLAAIFLLSLITIFSALAERPFPKPKGLVNDFANVISPAYKQKIAAVTGALLQKTGIPIVVVTMPDIGGAEYNDYANRLYRAWGIGKKGEDKGVLIFVKVTEARSKVAGATTVSDKIQANNQLSSALGRLVVVVERYPELKANTNFIRLQDELAGTENRIAVERRRFNEMVKTYNIKARSFPTNILAGMFGFEKATFFEVPKERQEAPKVKF